MQGARPHKPNDSAAQARTDLGQTRGKSGKIDRHLVMVARSPFQGRSFGFITLV